MMIMIFGVILGKLFLLAVTEASPEDRGTQNPLAELFYPLKFLFLGTLEIRNG